MPRIAAAIGPVADRRARDWTDRVHAPQTEAELDAVRRAMRRSSPFGSSEWQRTTAQRLDPQTTLRRVRRGSKNNSSSFGSSLSP